MRRHRVLIVDSPDLDGRYFTDVGIGERAPRLSLKLVEGLEQEQFGEIYKFEKDEFFGWVLWDFYKGEWRRFIAFTEEPQIEEDYVGTSFYCEKHPDSPFIHAEMFSLKTAQGRITLDGNVYKEFVNGEVYVKELSEEEMLARYGSVDGSMLDCDLIKVGHHGSSSSSCKEFLEAVTPDAGVISCGKGNRHGHPSASVLKRYESMNTAIYRTDLEGDIVFTSTGGEPTKK